MPNNPNGSDTPSRLDRLETMLEAFATQNQREHEEFQREHRQLLTAQVLLTETQRKADLRIVEVGEKLDALINLMDQHLRDHREGRA